MKPTNSACILTGLILVLLVVANSAIAQTGANPPVRGTRVSAMGHFVFGGSASGDGSLMATVAFDGWVTVTRTSTGKDIVRLGPFRDLKLPLTAAFSPDNSEVAVGHADGGVSLWDARHQASHGGFTASAGPVHSVTFTRDNKWLIAGTGYPRDKKGTIVLWNRQSRSTDHVISDPSLSGVLAVSVDRAGAQLVSTSEEEIRIWDVNSRTLSRTIKSNLSGADGARISPDGRFVACGTQTGLIIWNAATGEPILKYPSRRVCSPIAYTPDAKLIGFVTDDGILHLWDIVRRKEVRTFGGNKTAVLIEFIRGSTLVSVNTAGRVRLREVAER